MQRPFIRTPVHRASTVVPKNDPSHITNDHSIASFIQTSNRQQSNDTPLTTMSSIIDITGSFPMTECTPLPKDAPPNHATLQTLHLELNSCATAIPSNLGGGSFGHLFLCMPAAEYLLLPTAIPFIVPRPLRRKALAPDAL